ncbi:MAG: sulfatase [Planctomycetota bacterium]|nr:sulfatase [Planctomycetota bacterium]MDA1106220.1 sulfatase [Planctomycetota bacterium]
MQVARWIAAVALMGLASCAHPPARPVVGQSARPNIILFLVDDMGQQDVSEPMLSVDTRTPVNQRFTTPNVEALAARGVKASDAHSAGPVCTPSRTAILTGQCPARTHITFWTLEKDNPPTGKHDRVSAPAWNGWGAQPSATMWPALLHAAGYRTIHAGKAHFGARKTPGADPLNMGFDINIAGHAAGAPSSYLGTHGFSESGKHAAQNNEPLDAARIGTSVWDVPGLEAYHGQDVWLDDALAREACAAINDAVAVGQPFALNFCPYGVHAPIMMDERFAALSEGKDLDPPERKYISMVAAVDEALGTIVRCCEDLGVLDNTYIIFTSDNGGLSAHARGRAPDGQRAHTHNAPLRNGKGSASEGGTRVPFIAVGPGIAPATQPLEATITGTDLYPTILAMAGVPAPVEVPCDGVNVLPLLTGASTRLTRPAAIIIHQPHQWGSKERDIEPFTSIRDGDWKLIWYHDGPRVELYNLRLDLSETTDLGQQEPARANEMLALLRTRMEELGGQWSIDKATGLPIVPVAAHSPASAPARSSAPVPSPDPTVR